MNISLSLFSAAAAAALKQISYFFLLFGSVGHCCLLVGVVTFQHLIKINRFDTFKRARVHRTLNTHCVCVCVLANWSGTNLQQTVRANSIYHSKCSFVTILTE